MVETHHPARAVANGQADGATSIGFNGAAS